MGEVVKGKMVLGAIFLDVTFKRAPKARVL
jgi:hypothetical protein